jgi:hypothetical protein
MFERMKKGRVASKRKRRREEEKEGKGGAVH